MTNVPTLALSHLNEAERQAYVLADNKLAETAGWDKELLAIELQHLIELDFEVELTGFEIAEIDLIIEEADGSDDKEGNSLDDVVPEPNGLIVSKPGDIWNLGQHRLICGDARDEHVIAALLDGRRPHLMFTDPPYNVKIDGNVCGLGSRRGEIVIDCFAGSGSTLIAAEKSGRKAMLVEYEPTYCDTIIRRWQAYTGNEAIREDDGCSFDEAHSLEGSNDSDVDRIGAIS